MTRTLAALLATFLSACVTPVVLGVDATLGLSAPAVFYYGDPSVPVAVQVSNLGNLPGTPVVVSLQLSNGVDVASSGPAGWTCTGASPLWTCEHADPLPGNGALPDLEIELALGTPDEVRDTVRICAKVRVPDDIDPNNDSVCEVFQPKPPEASYDLAVTKTIFNAYNPTTGKVSYLVVVENLGPDAVMDVSVVEDIFPSGLTNAGFAWGPWTSCNAVPGGVGCDIAYIGVGQTRTMQFTANVDPTLTGEITNCATVDAPFDFEDANNEGCVSFTIGQPESFDLAVTAEILDEPDGSISGVYRWHITNQGINPTSQPVEILIDAPPAATTLGYVSGIYAGTISATNTVSCTPVGTKLSCEIIGVFQPGDSKIVWMSFHETGSTGAAPACLTIDPPGDIDAANNEACLALDVDPPVISTPVSLKLSLLGEPDVGDLAALRATLSNEGETATPAPLVLTLDLPPSLSFVGLGGRSGFTCSEPIVSREGETVTCFRETPLEKGDVETLDLSAWVADKLTYDICAGFAPSNDEGGKLSHRCLGER